MRSAIHRIQGRSAGVRFPHGIFAPAYAVSILSAAALATSDSCPPIASRFSSYPGWDDVSTLPLAIVPYPLSSQPEWNV